MNITHKIFIFLSVLAGCCQLQAEFENERRQGHDHAQKMLLQLRKNTWSNDGLAPISITPPVILGHNPCAYKSQETQAQSDVIFYESIVKGLLQAGISFDQTALYERYLSLVKKYEKRAKEAREKAYARFSRELAQGPSDGRRIASSLSTLSERRFLINENIPNLFFYNNPFIYKSNATQAQSNAAYYNSIVLELSSINTAQSKQPVQKSISTFIVEGYKNLATHYTRKKWKELNRSLLEKVLQLYSNRD